MEIFINKKPAEITLDTEKTLGDVMSGIEQWISPTGNRIQQINIDGKELVGNELDEAFSTNITDITKLDVFLCSWRELAIEALEILYETCILYMNTPFDGRQNIFAEWKQSPAARFLNSDIPDIHSFLESCFSGDGLSVPDLIIIIEERLREIADPWQEIANSEIQAKIISGRMEELPLDMQTGKDHRAAETILLFSQMGEKLFRIFFIHTSIGLLTESFFIDDLPSRRFIEEFNANLLELTTAYENQDCVLAGDIAEYELAPRLMKLFYALKNFEKSELPVLSGSNFSDNKSR